LSRVDDVITSNVIGKICFLPKMTLCFQCRSLFFQYHFFNDVIGCLDFAHYVYFLIPFTNMMTSPINVITSFHHIFGLF